MRRPAGTSDVPWRHLPRRGEWRAHHDPESALVERPLMIGGIRFEIYRDEAGAFRWRLIDHAIELAVCLDACFNDWNAHRGARSFKLGAAEATYRCREVGQGWVWEALSPDGRLLATCPSGWPDRRAAQAAAERARRAAPGATGP